MTHVHGYFQIKDTCRKGLLKYLSKVFQLIPAMESPKILDIGCGTGVPVIWLAENAGGHITAIDPDVKAIHWLKEKIKNHGLEGKINALNISFFDIEPDTFDIILAEGFLNVIGFEPGFQRILKFLRNGGYCVVHDEFKDHSRKLEIIADNHCILRDVLFLDEHVWWNDYYGPLEIAIDSVTDKKSKARFDSDLREIASYRVDPTPFRSIYYVIEKL